EPDAGETAEIVGPGITETRNSKGVTLVTSTTVAVNPAGLLATLAVNDGVPAACLTTAYCAVAAGAPERLTAISAPACVVSVPPLIFNRSFAGPLVTRAASVPPALNVAPALPVSVNVPVAVLVPGASVAPLFTTSGPA